MLSCLGVVMDVCSARAVAFVPYRNVGHLVPVRRTFRVSVQRFRIRGCSAQRDDFDPKQAKDTNFGGGEDLGAAKKVLASIRSRNADLRNQLRRYGTAGILSYGIFNTVYYLGAVLFFWFYVNPSPGRLGYAAAAKRLATLLAMVWAGSQVTKLLRAGAALALAPLVDRFLNWFTSKLHFKSREAAFGSLVAGCFGLALLVFVVLTILWA